MFLLSRSREGAWIEIFTVIFFTNKSTVAPARERGLKSVTDVDAELPLLGRSREGAWIEIKASERYGAETAVAPARERGLKSQTSGTTDVSPQSLPRGSVD